MKQYLNLLETILKEGTQRRPHRNRNNQPFRPPDAFRFKRSFSGDYHQKITFEIHHPRIALVLGRRYQRKIFTG